VAPVTITAVVMLVLMVVVIVMIPPVVDRLVAELPGSGT